ncbi:hypothetical protein FM037_24575 [Shewanella psychropiezotolerans]|uniref:Uncharacterized protein n=1 Tax=Shewanella psychropiezotolerans TaxID=2593655 RepID=A0ABX5XC69_9GAMM|nr:hypothetical protein FM037_24575 [Shewanella psychropiezotolerans]
MLLTGAFFSSNLLAADINCNGKVTVVMDYPNTCDGNTAFKTDGSKGKWVCPASDKGNALVLAAVMSGKIVSVYINSQNGALTCANLPNYVKAKYVIIYP